MPTKSSPPSTTSVWNVKDRRATPVYPLQKGFCYAEPVNYRFRLRNRRLALNRSLFQLGSATPVYPLQKGFCGAEPVNYRFRLRNRRLALKLVIVPIGFCNARLSFTKRVLRCRTRQLPISLAKSAACVKPVIVPIGFCNARLSFTKRVLLCRTRQLPISLAKSASGSSGESQQLSPLLFPLWQRALTLCGEPRGPAARRCAQICCCLSGGMPIKLSLYPSLFHSHAVRGYMVFLCDRFFPGSSRI